MRVLRQCARAVAACGTSGSMAHASWLRTDDRETPRWDCPIRSRYAHTSAARTSRGLLLMSDQEVTTVANIINVLVDMEYYSEEQEQEIFEYTVCRLVEVLAHNLPNELIHLVHSTDPMPKKVADELEQRLRLWLLGKFTDAPFLDDTDMRRVVRCTLVLLMRSMRKRGSSVGEVTHLEYHKLVVDVFIKGVIDVFYDPHERQMLVERIESYASAIPFLPGPVLTFAAESAIDACSDVVSPVLVATYSEYIRNSKTADFTALFREKLVAALLAHGKDGVTPVALALKLLPDLGNDCVLGVVDSFLEQVQTDKLEHIMRGIAESKDACKAMLDPAFESDLGQCLANASGHASTSFFTALLTGAGGGSTAAAKTQGHAHSHAGRKS